MMVRGFSNQFLNCLLRSGSVCAIGVLIWAGSAHAAPATGGESRIPLRDVNGLRAQRPEIPDAGIVEYVLSCCRQNLGEGHPECLRLEQEMAQRYEKSGELLKALALYEEMLDRQDQTDAPNRALSQDLVTHAIRLYGQLRIPQAVVKQRRVSASERRDIAISEAVLEQQSKFLGEDHPLMMTLKERVAEVREAMGDWKRTAEYYQELKESYLRKNSLSLPAADMALRLGGLYRQHHDPAQAARCYTQALDILNAALDPEHPEAVHARRDLMQVLLEKGRGDEARSLAPEFYQAQDSLMEKILPLTSERDRFRYLEDNDPYGLPAALGDVDRLAQAVLRYKGLVLDSLIEDLHRAEASDNSQTRELLAQRRYLKERLVNYWFRHIHRPEPEPRGYSRVEADLLKSRLDKVERRIAYRLSRQGIVYRALHVDVADVTAQLDPKSALVEMIRYPRYEPGGQRQDYYGAVILRRGRPSVWVELGRAEVIDQTVRLYYALLAGQDPGGTPDLSAVLHLLYRQVWSPVARYLDSGTRTVMISPDGMLNFVSFAVLLDERDHFLAERFNLAHVASGRDLLNKHRKPGDQRMYIFSNPRFSDGVSAAEAFDSLPGTIDEARRIDRLAQQYHIPVQHFTDQEASEENFRGIRSPCIVHLATHGFFDDETSGRGLTLSRYPVKLLRDDAVRGRDPDAVFERFRNPMHNSGFILAGGSQPQAEESSRDDGVMSAEEISLMNLDGTWLVVIPSCYTGLGTVRSVEGLIGLRRGFLMAGVQHMLTALWQVDDASTTPGLIEDFYRVLFETHDPVAALSRAQRNWLIKLRRAQGVEQAVRKVGPFILISQ